MWQDISDLFTSNKLIPVLFILAGLVLCIIEIFRFRYSMLGIIGGVVIIASLLAVMMLGGNAVQFVTLMVLILVIIIIAFCIMTVVTENNLFLKKRIKVTEDSNSVSNEDSLSKLIGKTGVALSELNPSGKISVANVTLDAYSSEDKIEKNKKVIIEKIDGIKIFVKGIDDDK